MKNLFKSYFQPTPRNARLFGDALLSVSTFIVGFSIYFDQKKIALAALVIGVIGKFITNFFKED